jgi:proline dehydrogenase
MFLAKRFVAGTTIAQALTAVRRLNADGLWATLDFLGEDVTSRAEAERTCAVYSEIIHALAESDVRTNLSVKLSALGLQFDAALAERLLESILAEAAALADPFVRIDMERAASVPATLEIFRSLFAKHRNTGPVLQAYLRRTPDDLEAMIALGARVRLCKGAYDEKTEVAHTHREVIRREYLHLAEALLSRGQYPGIATHDPGIIEALARFAKEHGIRKEAFEFQMLYGVRPSLQRRLIEEGFRLRIYVPFGTHWAGYLRRRILERRANAFFALSALFSR